MAIGRARRPFWAARPTRFAALSRGRARALLAVALVVALLCLTALGGPLGDGAPIGAARAEIAQSIVDGMRHGGAFYAVAHAIGTDQGTLTLPMPALPTIEAALPAWLTFLLLIVLMVGAAAAWFVRLRPSLQRGAALVPPMLLAIGVTMGLRSGLVALPSLWAGALIALSLAARRPGRWIEAVAIAAIAMLIEPAAALFAVVMLVFALREGDDREALGWATALGVFAATFSIHLYAADGGAPGSIGLLGLGVAIRAAAGATAFAALPMIIVAPLIGLSLVGWVSWPDPAGPRAAAIVIAYGAFVATIASGETIDLVMLVTPLLFVGLAFAPDAIGDLAHRALDRRRITVTRLTR